VKASRCAMERAAMRPGMAGQVEWKAMGCDSKWFRGIRIRNARPAAYLTPMISIRRETFRSAAHSINVVSISLMSALKLL
jgi:hypothetical protein